MTKPRTIRLMGEKLMPILRNQGYTPKFRIGTATMIVKELKLPRRSFGALFRNEPAFVEQSRSAYEGVQTYPFVVMDAP